MRRIHADLLLLLAAAIWGLAFVFQKTAMDHVGPSTFIAARSLIAAAALAPFAWSERGRLGRVPGKLIRIAMAGGLLFFVGAVFQQFGLMTATVSNTGFLTALYMILTPFMAWFWLRQRLTMTVWTAVCISFGGVWLLAGGSVSGFTRGDLLVAVCAVFWALHITVTASATVFSRPATFTAVQFATVGSFGAVSAALTESVAIEALFAAAPQILFVGVLSTAFTFTLLAIAIKHTTAAEAAIIMSLETVFAAIAGAMLLGERLSVVAWVGAALILSAIALVQLNKEPGRPSKLTKGTT